MIELNLLPDVKKEFIKAQRTRNTVISGAILVAIIAGGVVALLATTVYGAQSVLISNLKKEVKSNHQKVASKQEINKYLAIQSQLNYLDTTADQRSIYERLFDYLPQLNPAPPFNVTLYNVNLVKDTTSITMSGAANSFEAVNNFKTTLEKATIEYQDADNQTIEKPLFASVSSGVPSLSTVNEKTQALFEFTIVYSPEAFDSAITAPKIKVPKLVTSDSDQNAPKELFGLNPQAKPEDQNGQ